MKTGAGQRLGGRYVLEAPIGAGGMAEVWRARDEVLGRAVAIKLLHPHLTGDEPIFERFRHEAVMAARLSHPCIVRVFDTGVDDGRCYIVLELSEGETLADVLERRGLLDPGEAAGVLGSILEGLAHAHDRGVVHRDLKPGNVLVHDGQVKVADFGIAKAAFVGDLTTTGELLGTAAYLAPEQVDAASSDHRADLYAAGTVLYEMLTGRPPFTAETALATATLRLTTDPEPPSARRAGIPAEMERIVLRALERDPDRRFSSADEMRSALERTNMGVPVARPAAAPPPPRDEHSFFRSWMLVPAILIALAAVAVVVGLVLGRLELGGPLGVRPRDEGSPSPGAPAAGELAVQAVHDHDPPPGDGQEHPEETAQAIDRDVGTVWRTEHYTSPDLGGIKSGVGLVFDLGRSRDIREIALETPVPGWTFQVHGADDLGAFADPAALGAPFAADDGGASFVAETTTVVRFPEATARYVLVWITELAAVEGEYRAVIAEATFAGA